MIKVSMILLVKIDLTLSPEQLKRFDNKFTLALYDWEKRTGILPQRIIYNAKNNRHVALYQVGDAAILLDWLRGYGIDATEDNASDAG